MRTHYWEKGSLSDTCFLIRCGQRFVSFTEKQKTLCREFIDKLTKNSDLFITDYDPFVRIEKLFLHQL